MRDRFEKACLLTEYSFFLISNAMGITLSKKQLSKGRISLYLDICINGKRQKEYLGIILEVPTTKETKKANRTKLELAQAIRNHREMEYLRNRYHTLFQAETSGPVSTCDTTIAEDIDFFAYTDSYQASYLGKDIRVVRAVFNYLHKFHSSALLLADINSKFCHNFLHFLQEHLSGNSPVNYFKKFKKCLNTCVEEGLIAKNPAEHIRLPQYNEVTKEILSTTEITQLALTPCQNKEVKRAFLFSCHSGLRWCDIRQLRYKNIDFAQRRLTLIQQKVALHSSQAVLHLNLNESAIRLLKEYTGSGEKQVFTLPSHSYCLRTLNEWTRKAGITKHISFHCARHTFITHLMAGGANIKTVAALAGHSSTRHTEKYVHIIDHQKQQAVDNLPPLPL